MTLHWTVNFSYTEITTVFQAAGHKYSSIVDYQVTKKVLTFFKFLLLKTDRSFLVNKVLPFFNVCSSKNWQNCFVTSHNAPSEVSTQRPYLHWSNLHKISRELGLHENTFMHEVEIFRSWYHLIGELIQFHNKRLCIRITGTILNSKVQRPLLLFPCASYNKGHPKSACV